MQISHNTHHRSDPVDCYDLHVAPISPYDKESMFEKPLTPSDVGKLNRLVIPKQFAEKYFPIGGGDPAGTLLAFEDESGKCWRFRYSYWNSSQSYVLTKGWSRYVKEKSLDAGDVVVFERHRSDSDRFFIAWRRRGVTRSCYNAQESIVVQDSPTTNHERRRRLAEEETNRQSNNNSTRLVRLFGVNFECEQLSNTGTTSSQAASSSSYQQQQQEVYYRNYLNHMGHPPHHHYHHMEMELTQGGVLKQMGSHLGL